MSFTFDEITQISDHRLLQWLDIYEEAFPQYERSPVSSHLEDLYREPISGEARKHRMVTLDAEGKIVGMARYTYKPELGIVYLIYFAVAADQRNQGIGALQFAELQRRIRLAYPDVPFFTWEVEREDKTRSQAGKELAARRVAFYKRQGGHLLTGTGHAIRNRPTDRRLPMDVMYYPLLAVAPEEAIQTIHRYFGFSRPAAEIQIEHGTEPR